MTLWCAFVIFLTLLVGISCFVCAIRRSLLRVYSFGLMHPILGEKDVLVLTCRPLNLVIKINLFPCLLDGSQWVTPVTDWSDYAVCRWPCLHLAHGLTTWPATNKTQIWEMLFRRTGVLPLNFSDFSAATVATAYFIMSSVFFRFLTLLKFLRYHFYDKLWSCIIWIFVHQSVSSEILHAVDTTGV